MKRCHACKKELVLTVKIARRDECPACRADLHCCLNCTFYSQMASKQCHEPVAEPVKEKAKANYCDYFVFVESDTASTDTAAEEARRSLNDLFKR